MQSSAINVTLDFLYHYYDSGHRGNLDNREGVAVHIFFLTNRVVYFIKISVSLRNV